jgi:molecular chaperone GrpE
MSPDDPLRKIPPDPDPNDEIEILEVVGLDEDGASVAADPDEDIEVIFEEPGGQAAAPTIPAPTVETREDTALKERFIRLQADFENLKKRIDRERLDHLRHATSELVARLLPVLDNFDRAVASARPAADPVLEGVVLIQRQLQEELKREGLRPMDALGQPFDPAIHEAVATDPDSPAPAHTVTEVFQRGYFFHDRVLRPALVRVRLDGSEGAQDGGEES